MLRDRTESASTERVATEKVSVLIAMSDPLVTVFPMSSVVLSQAVKAKRAIIAEIKALTPDSGANKDEYIRRFKEIGFVPFKEKDNITKEFKDALNVAFPPSLNRNDLIRR